MKNIIKPIISLFLICLVSAFLLSFVHNITRDQILIAERENIEKSKIAVIPQAETFEELDGCSAAFDNEDNLIGYVYITWHKGYGGDITVMSGILADGTISGVIVLSHNETPGLGARVAQEDYLRQYADKSSRIPLGNNIDAVTGATISSAAVTAAVDDALELFSNINKNGEGR